MALARRPPYRTEMISFADVQDVVDGLRSDGCDSAARELSEANVGVFNSLELAMKWRFYVQRALALTAISQATRVKAQALFDKLDAELS